ncbi:DUF411 domain-containing protein [Neptuniibacter halophilus]|uniref:DUF411 domain-containing protein n=1 Tax=Neptuniibacter halophilus TaxID=651666 RepID=UPI0025733C24|nr:DUF411 domain-containing protein [Neptuniibacter halophilus]
MKRLIPAMALASLMLVHPAQAADPVWAEGATSVQYEIDVYHSPTCGCCKGWIEHLQDHHFKVNSIEMNDLSAVKQKYGVPPQGASCHTAVVNGRVVEGHVPAQDIKRLLTDEGYRNIRLLTVPGMPSGGPGMDMPGARKDDFSVFAVSKDDQISEFSRYSDY